MNINESKQLLQTRDRLHTSTEFEQLNEEPTKAMMKKIQDLSQLLAIQS